jgi:DnaJ-class molecular chaperone
MALEFKDYYRILGIDRKADEKAIKSAYRRLARKYHPDVAKGKDKDVPERFKEVSEAYEVLSDPEKRRRYDSLGPDWQRGASGGPGPGFTYTTSGADLGDLGDFSDFFRTIFGDLGVRSGRAGRGGGGAGFDPEDLMGEFRSASSGRARSRGHDVQASVDISLEDAFRGARKTFTMESDEPCSACRGSGNVDGTSCTACEGTGWQRSRRQLDVRIPPGVKTGQRVRVSGEGGGQAGARGDLYLTVTVAPHPLYERKGDDLQLELPVTAPEAALGASIEVPTLRGRVSMKIPPGTSSGRTFRLPGYGMPRVKSASAGDQLVRVKIVMPNDLSTAERELYERLKALRPDSPRAYLG